MRRGMFSMKSTLCLNAFRHFCQNKKKQNLKRIRWQDYGRINRKKEKREKSGRDRKEGDWEKKWQKGRQKDSEASRLHSQISLSAVWEDNNTADVEKITHPDGKPFRWPQARAAVSLRVQIVSHMLDAITSGSIWMRIGAWEKSYWRMVILICLSSIRLLSIASNEAMRAYVKRNVCRLWHTSETRKAFIFKAPLQQWGIQPINQSSTFEWLLFLRTNYLTVWTGSCDWRTVAAFPGLMVGQMIFKSLVHSRWFLITAIQSGFSLTV